ncbi:unnamed protein product [Didymodactylos carnosus]|nr:unnamed protein product [Didymodactylos carnosus]CAF3957168.1 unnamed protein product [Didymodactylos carnosus]
MISVSSSQTPLITIAAGSPTRSEIRVAASPKLPKATTVREIRISRPDSPSITLNRNQIGNGTPGINSGTGGAFHISVGAPNHKHYQQQSENFSSSSPINVRGRTSPAFRLIDVPVQRENNDIRDNQYMSNLISNRFKPLFAYSNNNTNNINPSTLDRRSPAPSQRPISRGATPPFSLSTLPPHSSPVPSPSSVSSPSQPLSSTLMRNVRGGSTEKEADIDHLTRMLMKSMNTSNEPNFFGMCARCNDEIIGQENGLVAMDRMYHVACFTCSMCACRLRGMHFYAMENKPYCEPCYINSLEKCIACSRPITDRILRATGKPYHPHCFRCVACTRSLDGIPFTIDATMQIHCIDCFHRKFAPRCYACNKPILPTPGQEETIRIVALDRSYHVDCYRCESCQIQFATDEGCYPLNDHILCIKCNRNHHHNNQKSKITAIIDNHYHHHLQNNIDDL